MLDDIYAEFLVKRKMPIGLLILKVVLILAAALILAVGLCLCYYTYSISGFIGFGVCIGVYFLVRSWNLEYEYIFTSGELTIDKVIDQSRRKKLVNIDMQKVELVAEYQSHYMDEYRNNQSMKVYDYTSQRPEAKKYAVAYMDAEQRGLYLIEPNEKLLKVMRNFAPRKIIVS